MKMRCWTATLIALMILMFLCTSCRKEQEEVSQKSLEEKESYTVGFHIARDADKLEKVSLKSREEKVSYAIGLTIGRDIDKQALNLDPELVARGFQDGFSGAPALTEEEIEQVREEFRKQRSAALEEKAAKNMEEGRIFLSKNAEKEGVVTLPSGLQYRVLTPGDGAIPESDDNVKVHYVGRFIDGTEFENTYAQAQPAVFPVRGVIPGWTEALQLMREGAKWEFFVPSDLAYGKKGAGKIIGPDKTLIFEIELIGIH